MSLAAAAAPPAGRAAGPALPGFLLMGATKAGTTSLHHWLGRHPEVFVHPQKEMRFFIDAGRWHEGLGWYADQFTHRGAAIAWGEASNGYARGTEYPGAPERIARHLPGVRLVYVVRDPMRRLVSHWRHRLATGREWRPIDRAVRADPAYVATGLYGAELDRWLAHVDRSQILVLQSEALFADPAPGLDSLCRHLGVTPRPDLPFGAENVSDTRVAVPRLLRRASARPGLRPLVRRIGAAWGARPGSRSLRDVDTRLPADLEAEIQSRFAADRPVLERIAGPNITEGWT